MPDEASTLDVLKMAFNLILNRATGSKYKILVIIADPENGGFFSRGNCCPSCDLRLVLSKVADLGVTAVEFNNGDAAVEFDDEEKTKEFAAQQRPREYVH
jgi:hypothetical protein